MRIFIYSLIVATAVFCVYFWYTSPEWSKDAETEMKRSDAIDYCKKLKEPGHWEHTDWRLPTSSELSAKELDKNKYWASDSANLDTEAKMSVICVRNMPEKAEKNTVANDEDSTVSPEETGQTPQSPEISTAQPNEKKEEDPKKNDKPKPAPPAKPEYEKCEKTFTIKDLTWCYIYTEEKPSLKQAKQYCEAIQHDGKKGWRLPTSNELDDLRPNYETYFPDSDAHDPPQRFWISEEKGQKGLYWDRFGQPNGIVSVADSICVHKN